MIKPRYFRNIIITPRHQEIYKRLGYRHGVTGILRKQKYLIERYIQEAGPLLAICAGFQRLVIVKKNKTSIVLSGGVRFRSRLLVRLLRDCDEMVCMAATAGKGIVEAIQKEQKKDFVRAVIFDAVASVAVDACLDWLQNYIAQGLQRQGKQLLGKRISCGYSDFSLSNQKIIYRMLKLKRCGITMTKQYMLIPEKSVTAITGIITAKI
ncbi:MAG: vitamin B12 dependent-methionine synthase activation domain-containing protein [Candidatus Omnitrophota bacterium]